LLGAQSTGMRCTAALLGTWWRTDCTAVALVTVMCIPPATSDSCVHVGMQDMGFSLFD
jgi:hypothetical protein